MLDRRTGTSSQTDETRRGDEPRPARAPARGLFAAFAPFAIRSFRFQWPADLLTSWAFEMEVLILGWYVLVETGSVLWLTAFGSVLYIGTLVAPLFGVASDRIGHRNVLAGMRFCYAALASTLMALAFLGMLTPAIVLVISTLMGIARSSDLGVRSALVADTMPPEYLIGAMGVSRATTDTARVAGALSGAGLFAAFGMGPAYVAIVCCYGFGALLTLGVTTVRTAHEPIPLDPAAIGARASPWRDLKEGIAYVRNTPRLLAAVWVAFLVNLTAFPLSGGLLPYVAREVYLIDQTGLGYLVAGFAGGALIGSIAMSHISGGHRIPGVMMASAFVWYALLLAFAQMRSMGGGLLFLALAGFVQSFSIVSIAVVLMQTSGGQFRGRVMGVRMLAIYSLPIGLLAAGALIERIGFHATATLYAVIGLVFTLIIALHWRADLWRPREI